MLDGTLLYYLDKRRTVFGSDPDADVVIGGVQILPIHCSIVNSGDEYSLNPAESAIVFVKGDRVVELTKVCPR